MRIVSVWLPRWPILRFLEAQARRPSPAPVDPAEPFVLSVDASGGPRIAALNEAAEALGLVAGDGLSDARARVGFLQVQPFDPATDQAALRRFALWATRYTPEVALCGEADGADGFFLEITGAAHLFGGEAGLLADLAARLRYLHLPVRLAIADTAGAAWALSRCHAKPIVALPSGGEAAALKPLPIEALRLSADTVKTLRRLGFKRIGALIDRPRAPFAARFETELLKRLDQALGKRPEPLAFLAPPPAYRSLRQLMDPIFTAEAVVAGATRLMQDLVPDLVRDGMGARILRLTLYRVDGEATALDIGLALPTANPAHVARLVALQLERLGEGLDAGFGFEAIGLAVTAAEPMAARQTELIPVLPGADREKSAALVDALRQRLGPRSVRQFAPVASHVPERSELAVPVAAAPASAWPVADGTRLRPPLMLAKAEPAEVVALVPEGPPQRFRWRGVVHDIVEAQGPERIADEWWRNRSRRPTRDYYVVEDAAGRRFWLYREGLYGRETASPHWFVHGLFA